MSSIYWYDLETFGINSRRDRIAQFAGLRTDFDLNPLSTSEMFYCKPALDTMVDPESCLITGITPQECEEKGVIESEFAQNINQIFSEAGTCVAGYNSIRFDDEFIRNLNYRNLIDPYAREYAKGNSRWDVIDMVRATYALRPEGIEWPRHEDGKPSFKLEDLTKANNLQHESAHDALSDVLATIAISKLIKQKQPQLFQYYFNLKRKSEVLKQIAVGIMKPIVHISGMIPAERGCLSIMLPLCAHPKNSNGIICYDLNYNPDDLIHLDADEIQDRIYTPQADLPEGVERIHLKTIHVNKSPFVAPLSALKNVDLERIQLNYQETKKHLEKLKKADDLSQKVQSVFSQEFDNDNLDIDEMLYSGFFHPSDRELFNRVSQWPVEKILESSFSFKDPRGSELLSRYLARNHFDQLNTKSQKHWISSIKKRLETQYGSHLELWFEKYKVLNTQNLDSDQNFIMKQVESFITNKLNTLIKTS